MLTRDNDRLQIIDIKSINIVGLLVGLTCQQWQPRLAPQIESWSGCRGHDRAKCNRELDPSERSE